MGFQQIGISDIDLNAHEQHLNEWLAQGYHGEMGFMAKHGTRRTRPDELEPGTQRVICARMDYLPADAQSIEQLNGAENAYISRYALGRDYHKLMRKRLAQLAQKIEAAVGPIGYRAFVDSAPVMERALAQKAGLGWFGKNAMLLNPSAGSLFFLGELYTDLPLPVDPAFENEHCGSCNACQTACPTGAIVADKVVDSRLCISYLTIELHEAIPEHLRRSIGNRIYGCDDCLAVCPWNKFARRATNEWLQPRAELATGPPLAELATLDDAQFRQRFAGSPVKRLGRERFLRNCLIAIGNSGDTGLLPIVRARLADDAPLARGMAVWALGQLAPAELQERRPLALVHEQVPHVRAEWLRAG